METIMIVTDSAEEDDNLVTILKAMFPDCEIQIFSRQTESLGDDILVRGLVPQTVTKLREQ
jgi:hypothetical protein